MPPDALIWNWKEAGENGPPCGPVEVMLLTETVKDGRRSSGAAAASEGSLIIAKPKIIIRATPHIENILLVLSWSSSPEHAASM